MSSLNPNPIAAAGTALRRSIPIGASTMALLSRCKQRSEQVEDVFAKHHQGAECGGGMDEHGEGEVFLVEAQKRLAEGEWPELETGRNSVSP